MAYSGMLKPMLNALALGGSILLLTGQAAQAADAVKVAYIPCGQINDGSWSQAGYEGVKDAQAALAKAGIKMTIDSSESLSPSKAEAAARDYASRGFQTVVLHCGTFADAAYNSGKDFPKTNFLIVVAPKSVGNVWSYIPAMQDVSFAAGYLASKLSKSNAVGVVGSFNFSNVTWQVEGFRLGARYGNPDIKTYATYINSFDDVGKAKEAAQAEIDSGADVIYSATDQASRGIYAAAAGAGALAMASYSDQSSLAPKTVVASALADIPLLVANVVQDSVKGKLVPGKVYALGMADGDGKELVINPAMASKIPAKTLDEVKKLIEDIRAGRLKVPAISQPGGSATVDLKSLTPAR